MNLLVKKIFNVYGAFFKPALINYTPLHLQIEPTNNCNLDCPFCSRREYVTTPGNMSLEQFRKILDIIHPTHITLSGMGEPTLTGDLFAMIRLCRERDINVNTTSNFIAINDKLINEFIDSGLNLLNISIDAASAPTYNLIRGRDKFNDIVNGVKKLGELKQMKEQNTPFVRLTFVIQKNNAHEIVDYYHLAREVNADAILYQIYLEPSIANPKHKNKNYLIENFPVDDFLSKIKMVQSLEKEHKKPATNAGYIKFNIGIIKDIYAGKKINLVKKCVKPWVSLYVTEKGDIRPCCSFGSKALNMGNIFETPIRDILNNKDFVNFRKKLKKGTSPDPICMCCIPESPLDIIKRSRWTPNFILKK